MIIQLNIVRRKVNDKIQEYFSASPNISYVNDASRWIFYKLRELRNEHAIHNLGYELEKIEYNKNNILYLYNYKQDLIIPKLYDTTQINYLPAQSKKCKYCIHKINTTKDEYCKMKSKKITKHLNYKCLHWNEVNLLNNGNIHIEERPGLDGGLNRKIQCYKRL